MPLTIEPMSRRGFCRTALGGVVAAAFSGIPGNARAEDTGRDHWVFLSDTHVPGDPNEERHGTNPCKNFADVRGAVLKLDDKPRGVVVTGDFAFLQGKPEDYQQLAGLVVPYTENGIPLHICLGNHDNIGNLHAAFQGMKNAAPPVAGKHITVLESPNANLFLLDSLWPGTGSGFFGVEQLRWLKKALDARKDKPALLFAHHNLDNSDGALMDREEFWSVIKAASQVKAYIYGHTHVYRQSVRDNVHLINLPALGWEFASGKEPLGWSDVEISGKGIQLTLNTVPASSHPKNGDVRAFEWMR